MNKREYEEMNKQMKKMETKSKVQFKSIKAAGGSFEDSREGFQKVGKGIKRRNKKVASGSGNQGRKLVTKENVQMVRKKPARKIREMQKLGDGSVRAIFVGVAEVTDEKSQKRQSKINPAIVVKEKESFEAV